MLTGIHLLVTYACNFECDHCFLYCGPKARGTFTLKRICEVLDESKKIGTVEKIFFEGGEPFLYYPVVLEGIRRARAMGFKTGVVTNAYGAISDGDAELWLRPLAEAGIDSLSVSDDSFHGGEEGESPARRAAAAAARLGIPASTICIGKPAVETPGAGGEGKGRPVIGGGARFRGRAVEKLTAGLPGRPWVELTECPYEDLASPSRVHVDAYGHVHLCQGLSMGNAWETPLSALVAQYDVARHPVCGPLAEGGPALLAGRCGLAPEAEYVDECHFCYLLRRALLDRFPEYLAPRQAYGLE